MHKNIKCELYHDHFQNFKRYAIPRAQLVIADIPYNLGNNAYASSVEWYVDGDNKKGESKKANTAFFDTDIDFRIAEFMHFCSNMLIREPKQRGKAPAMIVFCSGSLINMFEREPEQNTIIAGAFPRCLGSLINMFEQKCMNMLIREPKQRGKAPAMIVFCSHQQQEMVIEYGKQYGFNHYIPLVFVKNTSAQVLKANMRIVGATEYALVLYRERLPKFNNDGRMIKNWFKLDVDRI